MADVKLPPLPEPDEQSMWGEGKFDTYTLETMKEYGDARATAAKDAEIEALRAEVERWKVPFLEWLDKTEWVQKTVKPRELGQHRADIMRLRLDQAEARAERLAEALRGLKDLMLEQVKWEPCDCGCPQQRTPDGPHSVTWLRAAQQVDIAIAAQLGGDS